MTYLHLAQLVWETAPRNPLTVEEWYRLAEALKLYDDLTYQHWINHQSQQP